MKTRARYFGFFVSAMILSIPGWVNAEETEGTKHFTRYLTRNKVSEYMKKGVTHFVISGDHGRSGGQDSVGRPRLEYPQNSHIETMNDVERATFEIHPQTSAYPSPEQVNRINKLERHVQVYLGVEQCLTTDGEKRRLLRFKRPVTVRVECHSDRAYDVANRLAADIMNENGNVRIIVENRD